MTELLTYKDCMTEQWVGISQPLCNAGKLMLRLNHDLIRFYSSSTNWTLDGPEVVIEQKLV